MKIIINHDFILQMENEVPCRDTDPVNMNLVNKTADTMAFTVDFGQQEINQEEKVKKFERFAQRSSLRRVNSPRQKESEKVSVEIKTNNNSSEGGKRGTTTEFDNLGITATCGGDGLVVVSGMRSASLM